MHRLLETTWLGCLLLWSTTSGAALPELEHAWDHLSEVTTLSASFHQVQHRAILSVPLESRGTLHFARPDALRWETADPTAQTVLVRGPRLTLYVPSLGAPQELDMDRHPELRGLIRGLLVWLAGDLPSVERDYTVSWHPGAPPSATLVPRDPTLRSLIDALTLTLSSDGRYIARVTIVEPDQDRVEIELLDVELNPPLPDTTFELELPPSRH